MKTEKSAALKRIYEDMGTEEIARRLAAGDLSAVAVKMAQEELSARHRRQDEAPLPAPPRLPQSPMAALGGALIASVVVMLLTVLLAPSLWFMVLALVILPGLCALAGKAFPTFGLIVGWLLASTFVWLGALLWYSGAFKMKYGDYRPLEAILVWTMWFFVSVIAALLGSNMIKGALRRGPVADLQGGIAKEREQATAGLQRLP